MRILFLLLLFISSTILVNAQQTITSSYFEMRTYTVNDGKMPDLIQRFQNHTRPLFAKHGIESVSYLLLLH